jgi:hypothetical protein
MCDCVPVQVRIPEMGIEARAEALRDGSSGNNMDTCMSAWTIRHSPEPVLESFERNGVLGHAERRCALLSGEAGVSTSVGQRIR